MATLSHSESRRLYSWWWDSHICPKNSKWLQDNLTDMDSKVKSMIKLIEEDADSFARRAEMYYKKRPELMKLVEELYRAYRALAERYDHATAELRHAHKTMSQAFPNQLPFDTEEDIGGSSEGSYGRTSLKQLNQPSDVQVDALKRSLVELQVEREALRLRYQLSLNKLCSLEKELACAQKDAGGLDDQASKAEIEIKILKEALVKLEAERDDAFLQYNQSMERISDLEASMAKALEDAKGVTDRASEAEIEAQHLKEELSRLKGEKEAEFLRYKQCLAMISALETGVKASEESARRVDKQTGRAETEIEALKRELLKLKEEKEDVNISYQQCLETIAKLEREISRVQEDAERLAGEVQAEVERLKGVEDQRVFLESSNKSLQLEAENLAQKIAVKDQALFEKQDELVKVQELLQNEQFRFEQLEASLKNLQNLHSQSQEEQKSLTLDLQNQLQVLHDLKICNRNLEYDVSHTKEENQALIELNNSSTISLQIQRDEISSLRDVKQNLEEEVARQVDQSNFLQEEVHRLKEEIDDMSRRYQMLMEQVKLAGLNPECISSSVKKLRDENSKLIELCNNQKGEQNTLRLKLKEMDGLLQKKAVLENSLLKSNTKLEGSRDKVKDLHERCESLYGEKSDLVAERANLLSQLQLMTANMQKLLEKNTSLENSLSVANIEIQGLREKSRCFEEFFQLLKSEKSEILKERESLVSQLNRAEERHRILEKSFSTLEGEYANLQREKQLANIQVEELKGSLAAEKQERTTYVHSCELRLTDLQNHVTFLQEECRSKKKEVEDQLDRVVNAQVELFILRKFIEDLEQKNFTLLIECQRYVQASELSEKIISELENENLEQQMEAEFLVDEIENLRTGIYQVSRALQLKADHRYGENKKANNQFAVPLILDEIDNLKCLLSSNEDEKLKLVLENSVLLSLLGQIGLDGVELKTQKNVVMTNLNTMKHSEMLQKENNKLTEINKQLKADVISVDQTETLLRGGMETQRGRRGSLQEPYLVLQREYCNAINENKGLLKRCSELKDELYALKEETGAILQEAISIDNMSLVYKCFGSEKTEEVEALSANLESLRDINTGLKQKAEKLEEKLNVKEAESCELSEKLKKSRGTNEELCKVLEDLKKEFEESKRIRRNIEKQNSELFELIGKQQKEMEHLTDLNENLETEVGSLHKEIQEQQLREQHLNLELQEKQNEFGLWDAEATSFFFDIQTTAVREVFLENKVHELTEVCENLRDEIVAKSTEVEQIKEKLGSSENQREELTSQLSAYAPIVASLRVDVGSLEESAISLTKLSVASHQPPECVAGMDQGSDENGRGFAREGILCLQEIQTKIRAVKQAVSEEGKRFAEHTVPVRNNDITGSSNKSKNLRKEEEIVAEDEVPAEIRKPKTKPGLSEIKTGLRMKDIPLDQVSDSSFNERIRGRSRGSNEQMLELWEESADQDSTIISMINANRRKQGTPRVRRRSRNPSLGSQIEKECIVDKLELSRSIEDKGRIFENLTSDSRRLTILQTSVRELKRMMEMNERHRRSHNPDHEKVKRQLKEVEEIILRLINTNETLSKDAEEIGDARDVYRKRVVEQSRSIAEKIEELQFDVQNIERVLLKLEDGAKSKGKKRFSESRTVLLLRDIMHKGDNKRTGRKKKKNRFCGCIRSSSQEV